MGKELYGSDKIEIEIMKLKWSIVGYNVLIILII
jgi:hypothetical protein